MLPTAAASPWLSFTGHPSIHRSPFLWVEPDAFRPERFSKHHENPDFKGAWAGYNPELQGSALYPNEVTSDFAFIPFGVRGGRSASAHTALSGLSGSSSGPLVVGGSRLLRPASCSWLCLRPDERHRWHHPAGGGMRKCVGDQFALTEATVALAMLLRTFDFRLAATPEEIGMATGATIHTANGMRCIVRLRQTPSAKAAEKQAAAATS